MDEEEGSDKCIAPIITYVATVCIVQENLFISIHITKQVV